MKLHNYIFIVLVFFLINCSSWKRMLVDKGTQNDAVQNAIIDFLYTSRLSKSDSVFSIYVENIDDNVLGVKVGGEFNKLLPGPENRIGTKSSDFPSRYIEKEGKLFYWVDSTHILTKDMVSILSKYNHIDSLNVNGFIGIPETSSLIDDSKKVVHYFFCKSNISMYKKVTTNIGMGYYEPPKLDCPLYEE
ncbi:hypothetical protein LS482_09780 [Sinomicrobium kalidii]|uniref:hypothetical protein n=1 Tax=Sinomicrobium kalidii TaxID=2900738 RepID=UPI001E4ED6E6|nr:hypothetical protein [Sinomicrobium kalidii]UGU18157.1 hypothetical protein LS482_09780 [Sinomicrobium kalidii]